MFIHLNKMFEFDIIVNFFRLYLKNLPVFITPDAIRIVFPKINQVRIQQSEPHRK